MNDRSSCCRSTGQPDVRAAGRFLAGLALAAAGAAMFVLAFPPYDLWPLAFFWIVPVVVSLHRVMPQKLAGLALGVGVGGFFWGYFGGMFAGYPAMQWLPVFIGVAAAAVGYRERAFHLRTGYRWFVLQGAFLWVGIEMIRGFIPVVGTWGFAAYTLYRMPQLIQPVSIFGTYGMSLLLMLFNFAAARLAISEFDRRCSISGDFCGVDRSGSVRWVAGVCLLLVVWGAASLIMYQVPEPDLQVAAVQPAAYISPQADDEGIDRGLQMMARHTRSAAGEGAGFVVWPEAFFPFDPQHQETEFFRQLAEETGAYLVIGYAVRTPEGLRNEAAVLSPDGEFLGTAGKDHPVTFAGETSITRGTNPVYQTNIGRVGTIICYDLDFTDTARRVAAKRAQLVGVPSWDWPEIAHKHYTHLVFRAVENRMAMVKADTAYDSAVIDPFGNIVDRFVSVEGASAVVTAAVSLGSADSPYIRLGDWVGWLSLAGMLFFIGFDLYSAYRQGGEVDSSDRQQ